MLRMRENESLTDWTLRNLSSSLVPYPYGQCDNEFPGVDNQGERCTGLAVVCDMDGIHYCRKCRRVEGL